MSLAEPTGCLKSIFEILKCPICQTTVRNPVHPPCLHVVCQDCATDSCVRMSSPTCRVCSTAVRLADFRPAPHMLQNLSSLVLMEWEKRTRAEWTSHSTHHTAGENMRAEPTMETLSNNPDKGDDVSGADDISKDVLESQSSDRNLKKKMSKREIKPENSRRIKIQGDVFYEQANYVAAIDAYTRALNLNDGTGKLSVIYGNRSAANFMLHNYKECVADCELAISNGDNSSKLFQRAAKAETILGNFSSALQLYERAQEAVKGVAGISFDTEIRKLQRCIAECDRCLELQKRGKWSDAYAAWTALSNESPENVFFKTQAFECRIALAPNSATLTQIVEDIKSCIRSNHESSVVGSFQFVLAKTYYYGGFDDFPKVLEALSHCETETSRSLFAIVSKIEDLKQRGNQLFQNRKWIESIAVYSEAIDVSVDNKQVLKILYCNRAAAHKEVGEYRAAILDCTKAIEIDNNFMKAFSRRARCYAALNQWEFACPDYARAVMLDGERDLQLCRERTTADAHYARAKEKEKEKESQKAQSPRPGSSHGTSSGRYGSGTFAGNNNYTRGNSFYGTPRNQVKTETLESHYNTLGIPRTASDREVRAKFRELSLKYHPDKCVGMEESGKLSAEQIFKAVNEAYSTLSDNKKRREYDLKLDREARGQSSWGPNMYTSGAYHNFTPHANTFRRAPGSFW